jgi:ECF sigma factor
MGFDSVWYLTQHPVWEPPCMQDLSAVPSVKITQLLKAWRRGEEGALGRLLSPVQAELYGLAHHDMSREEPGQLVQRLNVEDAELLKVSPETVKRDWRLAKTWLHRSLVGEKSDEGGALAAS